MRDHLWDYYKLNFDRCGHSLVSLISPHEIFIPDPINCTATLPLVSTPTVAQIIPDNTLGAENSTLRQDIINNLESDVIEKGYHIAFAPSLQLVKPKSLQEQEKRLLF